MSDKQCSHVKEPLFSYVKDCYWSLYRSNTAILSSTCRQLALGIGGILLIQGTCTHGIWNRIILTLLVLFFLIDAGQYLNQSILFQKLAKDYDNKIKAGKIVDVSQLEEPGDINKLTNCLFIIKIILLVLAAIVFIWLVWVS